MILDAALKSSQAYALWKWLSRRHEPESGRIVLVQRRVYVLPTRHGLSFGLSLLLMLVGSINYNLSLGYVMTFLLAGMAIVSILHTFRNIAHLAVTAGKTEPAFAGELAQFGMNLENEREDVRHAIHVRCGEQVQSLNLPGRSITTMQIPVRAAHRGWLQLPRVTLENFYPLGMFRAWSYVQPEIRALIYPRPDGAALPPLRTRTESGDSVNIGTGTDDFAGLRNYQTSDSPRHIAWKAVARTDAMVTKSFMGRAGQELILDWNDLPPSMDVEARLSRLTRWVLLASEAGVDFALDIPGTAIPAGRGEEHRSTCLAALALYEPGRR